MGAILKSSGAPASSELRCFSRLRRRCLPRPHALSPRAEAVQLDGQYLLVVALAVKTYPGRPTLTFQRAGPAGVSEKSPFHPRPW